MFLKEVFERILRLFKNSPNLELRIVVQSQGSVGGTPSVAVSNVQAGFDWDSGKLLIYPEQVLTALTPEDIAAIRESVSRGQSWHAYQQYKKQAERIKALEQELAALRAPQGDSREGESEYQRGVRHGYNRRDAEVKGALL